MMLVSIADPVSEQQCHSGMTTDHCTEFVGKLFSPIPEVQAYHSSSSLGMADSVSHQHVASELCTGSPENSIIESQAFNDNAMTMANSVSHQQSHAVLTSKPCTGLPETSFSPLTDNETFNSNNVNMVDSDPYQHVHVDKTTDQSTSLLEKSFRPIPEVLDFNSKDLADLISDQHCNAGTELCIGLTEKTLRPIAEIQAFNTNGYILSNESKAKQSNMIVSGKPPPATASVPQTRHPNRYFENVKHKGDGSSDESESCSDCSWDEDEDGKRSDTIYYCLSKNNIACKKHSKPFIKKSTIGQHVDLNFTRNTSTYNNGVTPGSLLDIFCHRLEDDYDLDMDNIIIYVKNIIEQLKSISNGDYMTREAKEKWMHFPSQFCSNKDERRRKKIETTVCMPHRLENKISGWPSTWKTVVESGMDVRSLIEVFERSITIEIPKMLTGTYRLFDERNGDIRCKEKRDVNELTAGTRKTKSSFRKQPYESGHNLGNANGFAILEENQTSVVDLQKNTLLALPCRNGDEDIYLQTDTNIEQCNKISPKVVEITNIKSDNNLSQPSKVDEFSVITFNDFNENLADSVNELVEIVPSDTSPYTSHTMISLTDVLGKITPSLNSQRSSFNPTSPEDLKVTIQSLDIQSCLNEESDEDGESPVNDLEIALKKIKQSSNKSPYDIPVQTIEDRRRKRLLQIRETTEKRKTRIMHEKFPQKYGKCAKGHMAPSATSSVTKLSISNKSFYNSIFGVLGNIENSKNLKTRTNCRPKKNKESEHETSDGYEIPLKESSAELSTTENIVGKLSTPNTNNNGTLSKFEFQVNNSKLNLKRKKEKSVTNVLKRVESSLMSSESSSNINLQMMAKFLLEYNKKNRTHFKKEPEDLEPQNMTHITKSLHQLKSSNSRSGPSKVATTDSSLKLSVAESRVLHVIEETERVSDKKYPSLVNLECRESIDKIYDLMKKIGRTENTVGPKTTKTKFTTTKAATSTLATKELLLKDSDSGMSTKQSTSFMSLFSGGLHSKGNVKEKPNIEENNFNLPKVIISVKNNKIEKKLDRENPVSKFPKNVKQSVLKVLPLTIQENFQEVSKIQKNKKKIPNGYNAKTATSPKINPHIKTSQLDNIFKEIEQDKATIRNHFKNMKNSEKNKKSITASTLPERSMPADTSDKKLKKHIHNFEDACKEVRGEPTEWVIKPRQSVAASRLEALAQPRKTYVQANSEDLRIKYGRNLISDRLHRLANAATAQPVAVRAATGAIHNSQIRSTQYKDISHITSTKIPGIRKNELRQSSNLEARMAVNEGIPTGKATLVRFKDPVDVFGSNSLIKPKNYNDYGNIRWKTHVNSNIATTGKTYIPLVPKHSEQGDIETQVSSEESKSSLTPGNGHLAALCNEIFADANADDLKTDEDKTRIAKIKNGKVVLDSEDLIDADILILSQEVVLKKTAKNSSTQLVSYKEHRVDSYISLKERFSQPEDDCMLQMSNVSLTCTKSSRSLFLLQAGDASTVVTFHGPLVQNLTENKTCYLEPFKKMTDINNWIHLDVASIPMQVNTVGYSFPIICRQQSTRDYKMDQYSNTTALERTDDNFGENRFFKNNENINISPLKEKVNEEIDHEKSLNEDGVVVNLKEDHEPESAAPNLDCTSSLDVLVNLLNEIRNISTRQTHIASSVSFYNKEEEAKASKYNIKSTTENGTTCDIVTISSKEDIKKLEPYSGIYSLYVSQNTTDEAIRNFQDHAVNKSVTTLEDNCPAVESPQKELLSKCTSTHSQHTLWSMPCKATSATDFLMCPPSESEFSKSTINLETKHTDLISFENVLPENLSRKTAYQIISVYKRHSLENLLDPGKNASQNVREVICNDRNIKMQGCRPDENIKIKRDVLIMVYAVLIFTVFAALSYPDILLLQS